MLMKKIDRIALLISDYLRNDSSREEYDEAIEILKDPYSNLGLRSILSREWDELEKLDPELDENEKKDIRLLLPAIHHEINLSEGKWEPRSNFKISGILVKIAAILLLPVMVVSLWYFIDSRNPYQSTDSFITISTPNGSRIKTELPDGTIVWQNSGSVVKYPRNFTRRNRQVILSGEAFFDVRSDKMHPLYVTTRDLRIRVTGTRFNITSYDDEPESSVVLEKGKITVEKLDSGSSVEYFLLPGDRLIDSPRKGLAIFHNTDVEKYTSWIEGKLIFENDPLEVIMKKLSRWYSTEIVVNDPGNRFRNLPFTMTIENETLPQVLEYLRYAAPFSIKEEKLVLKEDGSFSKQKYVIEYRN